jgi:adenylylsulfate kinase-like enzyme
VPETPEVKIDTTRLTPEQAAETILDQLRRAGIVSAI